METAIERWEGVCLRIIYLCFNCTVRLYWFINREMSRLIVRYVTMISSITSTTPCLVKGRGGNEIKSESMATAKLEFLARLRYWSRVECSALRQDHHPHAPRFESQGTCCLPLTFRHRLNPSPDNFSNETAGVDNKPK